METVYRQQTIDRQIEKNKKLMTIGLAALCGAFVVILAKAWLEDDDAVEDKAGKYFRYIVKH